MQSQSTEGRDPVTAAFTAWSEALAKPWPGGFGWPSMPFTGVKLDERGAAFGAMMDFQRQALRSWLDFAALPFAAFGSAIEAPVPAKRAPVAPKLVPPATPAPTPTTVVQLAPRAAAPAPVVTPAPAPEPKPAPAPEAKPSPAAASAPPAETPSAKPKVKAPAAAPAVTAEPPVSRKVVELAPRAAAVPPPTPKPVPAPKLASVAAEKPSPAPAKASAPPAAKPAAAAKPASVPAEKPLPAPAKASPPPAEKPAAKSTAAKPKAMAAPAAPDPTSIFDDKLVEKVEPPMLAGADGAPDDLVVIKGIGPKLSKLLNDLGIYHYRQIAAWTAGEIVWINAKIDFKGRVQREKWVSQARALTK